MLIPLALALLAAKAEAPPPEPIEPLEHDKPDAVQLIRGTSAWDLDWVDAEDRLHGTIRPLEPVAGQPLEVSMLVGTFQGADFDGPVSLSLRCDGWDDTQTVRRAKGEKAWFVRFVPQAEGECSLDTAFTTTRHKRLHTKLTVNPAPLSRLPWYVLLGLISALALGLGIRAIFRKPEQA